MKNYWTQSEENIFVAAHRGFSAKYPENTMAAFRAAIELGVDQIETDVRITKDGVLVLVHDGMVDRTSNGTGVVHDMTYAELMELDFGSWKGEEFKGEKIVTLRTNVVKFHHFGEWRLLFLRYSSKNVSIKTKRVSKKACLLDPPIPFFHPSITTTAQEHIHLFSGLLLTSELFCAKL